GPARVLVGCAVQYSRRVNCQRQKITRPAGASTRAVATHCGHWWFQVGWPRLLRRRSPTRQEDQLRGRGALGRVVAALAAGPPSSIAASAARTVSRLYLTRPPMRQKG